MSKSEIINFHHVGARSGSSVPVLRMLGREQAIWLYDADPDCVDQVKGLYEDSVVPVDILPVFVGEKSGPVDFHLNYDPYTSSCLPNDQSLKTAYVAVDNDNGDYLLTAALSNVRTVTLQSDSLDNLSAKEAVSIDYLSLDVQGGELNILKGAARVLDQQCLAIYTEVFFQQIYEGQPLADDIFSFCRKSGFRFMRIEPGEDSGWFRGPLGWRGRSATFSGDVLFYKDPQVIRATHRNWNVSLKKLAMIALTGGYFEFCLECLLLCDASEGARAADRNSDFKYVRILGGFRDIYDEEPHLYVPSFPQIYSVEESYRRFDGTGSKSAGYDFGNLRRRYFATAPLETFKPAFHEICAPGYTRLEQYLVDSSLLLTAGAFRDRRLEQARTTARLLGLVGADGQIDLGILDRLTQADIA